MTKVQIRFRLQKPIDDAMAARISGVGRVTVSERRSIHVDIFLLASELFLCNVDATCESFCLRLRNLRHGQFENRRDLAVL